MQIDPKSKIFETASRSKDYPKGFYHKYNRVREAPVTYVQVDKVARAGYRTIKQEITELLAAGKALDEHRRFTYQHPDGVIPPSSPPANRPPDWDVVDQRRETAELKSKAEASLKAEQEEQERLNKVRAEKAEAEKIAEHKRLSALATPKNEGAI